MRSRRWIAGVALALAGSIPALATDVPELGRIDFPTSGAPEAQEPFLRGVLLLHSFEYDDAREAFREARRIDPDFALAAWGEAMTHNHPLWRQQDREAARTSLAALGATVDERLAKAPTEREKGYLRAVEALYAETGSKLERDEVYERKMAELSAAFSDDLEAKAFWALSILGTAQAIRDFSTYMRAAAVAEEVFAVNPRHPGAAHYLIHSYDDPIHAPLGVRAARVYADIAPAASHAQHMISHIWVALGRWQESVDANVISYEVSVKRARAKDLGVDDHNYHALHWLQYSRLQLGQHAAARTLLEEMRAMATESRSPRALEYYGAMRAGQLVEAGAVGLPAPLDPGASFGARVDNAFASGWNAASVGDRKAVAAAAETIRRALAETREDRELPADLVGVAEVLALELDALEARVAGETDAAIEALEAAAAREGSMALDYGPPPIVKPSHELLGELLLELGRYEEALGRFDEALARAPRRTRSLAGRATSAAALDRKALLDAACGELAEILDGADEGVSTPAICGGSSAGTKTSPPTAADLLARSIAYHDPESRFLTGAHRFEFRESRPDAPDREVEVVIDVPGERFSRTVRGAVTARGELRSGACSLEVDGREPSPAEVEEHRLDCDRLRTLRNYYTFLWGLPMKLTDPGTRLGEVTPDSFEGEKAWKLRATWDEAVGTDVWYLYFEPATARLVGYRFYHDEAKNDGEVIDLEGELVGAGMRLPAERSWTTHEDDRFLGTDRLVAISEDREKR